MRKKIIQFINQKGGVGKSTSSIDVAAGLAIMGRKTLLIDVDPQENSSKVLYRADNDPHAHLTSDADVSREDIEAIGLPSLAYDYFNSLSKERNTRYSLYGLLVDDVPVQEVILPSPYPNLDFIPSHLRLSQFDLVMSSEVYGNRSLRLKNALAQVEPTYDFIIIDTPPSLSLLTVNALAAADVLVIPVSGSYFAMTGINQLIESIVKTRRSGLNPNLEIIGLLCTMMGRNNVSKDTERILRKYFGDKVFKTTIPKNVSIEEAHSRRMHVFDYAPTSKGARAYKKLVEEIIGVA